MWCYGYYASGTAESRMKGWPLFPGAPLHAPKSDKTPICNTTAHRCCRVLFFKIQVRLRLCQSYPLWLPLFPDPSNDLLFLQIPSPHKKNLPPVLLHMIYRSAIWYISRLKKNEKIPLCHECCQAMSILILDHRKCFWTFEKLVKTVRARAGGRVVL